MQKNTHRVHWGPSSDFNHLIDVFGNLHCVSRMRHKFIETHQHNGRTCMEYCPYDKIWFEYQLPACVNQQNYLIDKNSQKVCRLDVGQSQQ